MTKKHERRAAAVTETRDSGRTFTARAVAYDVVDSYKTRFKRGVFNAGLEERAPVVAWSHQWEEPIGKVIAWEDKEDGLYITARFSDPDAVPRSRQAISQVGDGTLTDVSVGFSRVSDKKSDDGIVDITEAVLDEVSVVLRGAVPGAEIVSVRSGQGRVSEEQWLSVAKKLAAGELTEDEAKAALKLLAEPEPTGDDPQEEPPLPAAEVADLTEDIDAALASIGRAAPR